MKYVVVGYVPTHLEQALTVQCAAISSYFPETDVDGMVFALEDAILPSWQGYVQQLHVVPTVVPDVNAMADAVAEIAPHYDGVVVLPSTWCSELTVLIAAKLGWQYANQVEGISIEKNLVLCRRQVYNYNMEATQSLPQTHVVLGFVSQKPVERSAPYEKTLLVMNKPLSHGNHITSHTMTAFEGQGQPSPVLVVAGRGVGGREEVDALRQLAMAKGFDFGVSRPVAMSGWGKLSEIVGVSGNSYAPQLCITFGVSGSAAFYAGIGRSGTIVAVNDDPNAPIIGKADVSIVDDYAKVAPHLLAKLKSTLG